MKRKFKVYRQSNYIHDIIEAEGFFIARDTLVFWSFTRDNHVAAYKNYNHVVEIKDE